MDSEHSGATFQTTNWSQVLEAGHGADTRRWAALEALLQRYHRPLQVHLMTKYRIKEDKAAETLQDFTLERILQNEILAKAERARGRFRTFLLTALDRHYLNQIRDAQAQRRVPTGGLVSTEEVILSDVPAAQAHPEVAFDRAWAVEVMRETARRMEAECIQSGRLDIWEIFHARLLGPLLEGQPPADYTALVERLGIQSSTKAALLLTTGKRAFVRLLRAVTTEHAGEEDGADQEIEEIKAILSFPDAWNRLEPGK